MSQSKTPSAEDLEQVAWDRYAAAYTAGRMAQVKNPLQSISKEAASYADALLAERRKRFGSPETMTIDTSGPPSAGTVSQTVSTSDD